MKSQILILISISFLFEFTETIRKGRRPLNPIALNLENELLSLSKTKQLSDWSETTDPEKKSICTLAYKAMFSSVDQRTWYKNRTCLFLPPVSKSSVYFNHINLTHPYDCVFEYHVECTCLPDIHYEEYLTQMLGEGFEGIPKLFYLLKIKNKDSYFVLKTMTEESPFTLRNIVIDYWEFKESEPDEEFTDNAIKVI